MYERFDEVDSNMFGQGDVMSTQICKCDESNSQKQLPVCNRHKHCCRDNCGLKSHKPSGVLPC